MKELYMVFVCRYFTMLELMLVIFILGILAGLAVPNFIRYREYGFGKTCSANLLVIEQAKDGYLQDIPDAMTVTEEQLNAYVKFGIRTECPLGDTYTNLLNLTRLVECPVNGTSRDYHPAGATTPPSENGFHDLSQQ